MGLIFIILYFQFSFIDILVFFLCIYSGLSLSQTHQGDLEMCLTL